MNSIFHIASRALVAGGAVMVAASAFAQATVTCEDPRVDRTACYREAAAAQEAKRQGRLNSPGGYDENALRRCQHQPAGHARTACEKRVTGAGNTKVHGSVQGGGKIRRNEMPVEPKK
ncbi:hypothetical protein [Variovorax sp. YR216]|uniref:hypothetical protein n=1 Tax=Variovorax sp. YR216 TaxID=1882828 RepID=UPI00115FA300|nr:hypothetical protein [Variovorax sp. YR216]